VLAYVSSSIIEKEKNYHKEDCERNEEHRKNSFDPSHIELLQRVGSFDMLLEKNARDEVA
jgi:hypothetical protein